MGGGVDDALCGFGGGEDKEDDEENKGGDL